MIKRLLMNSLRLCQRGDLGQITVRFSHRNDQLIDLCPDKAALVAAIMSSGRSCRIDPNTLKAEDSTGLGQRLGIDGSETVVELAALQSRPAQQDSD